MKGLDGCYIIELEELIDVRGRLSFVEVGKHLDFDIKRNYFIYGVPGGEGRGQHAHKELHQFVMCLSGSFEIELYDGKNRITYFLNKPSMGLYICPLIWRELKDFSTGAVCSVLASEIYKEDDYIRDLSEFEGIIND